MKNVIVSLFFTLAASLVFSQNKPQKNDFGIGIDYKLQKVVYAAPIYYPNIDFYYYDYSYQQVNLFPALKFDYYLQNDLSLNLYFRPIVLSSANKLETVSPRKSFSEYKFSRFSMDLGLGLEKHFFEKKKIDPFIGFNFHYLFSGKEILKSNSKSYDYDLNYLRYDYSSSNKGVENHGFYSTLNFGLNYFLLHNFSLGINLDLGYSYSSQIGKTSSKLDRTEYDSSGNVIDVYNSSSANEIENISSNFVYSFSLKTAFYFPVKKKEK